ncbi:MAG: PepSY-like domain-containing protein [Rikenellaceae bacterium]|nr:PepSY-like domain-containing protein [Rikenellaceae bacterium]
MKRIYLLAISFIALFSLTGCELYDEYGEMMIRTQTDNIKEAVAELYPQAHIVEMDNDYKTIEVDIIDNEIRRDVYFNLSLNWLRTETDIRHADLPIEAANKIATKYTSWFIDSVKTVDTPQGSYYLVELDRGERDKKIKIDASGNIL